jgi:hypothetical protein
MVLRKELCGRLVRTDAAVLKARSGSERGASEVTLKLKGPKASVA